MTLYLTGIILQFIILVVNFYRKSGLPSLDVLITIICVSFTSWVGVICSAVSMLIIRIDEIK